jgi:hypothetical protein
VGDETKKRNEGPKKKPPRSGTRDKKEETRDKTRTEHDVPQHLIVAHLDVADRDTETEDLLELELDRRADFGELCGEVFGVAYGSWEFTGCAWAGVRLGDIWGRVGGEGGEGGEGGTFG